MFYDLERVKSDNITPVKGLPVIFSNFIRFWKKKWFQSLESRLQIKYAEPVTSKENLKTDISRAEYRKKDESF